MEISFNEESDHGIRGKERSTRSENISDSNTLKEVEVAAKCELL